MHTANNYRTSKFFLYYLQIPDPGYHSLLIIPGINAVDLYTFLPIFLTG
jgi:hypothetical protein